MPRTLGDSLIHMSHIDCMVEHDTPLPEIAPIIRTPEINEIARLIADNLVEDGATLQTGNLLQSSSHLSNVLSVVTPPKIKREHSDRLILCCLLKFLEKTTSTFLIRLE